MATITVPSRVQHSTRLLDSLLEGIVAFVEGVREGRDMARNYSVLSRMSKDELAKRGFKRSDISRLVVTGHA